MNQKKGRRVWPIFENAWASRRRRFYAAAPAGALLLLWLYVLAASVILVLGRSGEGGSAAGWLGMRAFLIVLGLMAALGGALGVYVGAYQPRLVQNPWRGLVFLALLLGLIVVIRVGVVRSWSPYLAVAPVLMTGITMTIAYGQRFALGASAHLLLVAALALMQHTELAVHALTVLLAAGAATGAAILCLRDIRTRTRLIEVCGLAAAVVSVMIWLTGLWLNLPKREIWAHVLWAAGGALAVGFVLQGLLRYLEPLFGIATSLTLLDWAEPNRALLKRLAIEAPGTFNHSLQIGMLAEAAAETIGGNGLLCRVGSYYHDIGKMAKPRYFVENQAERINQHKELAPTMSRLIIVGHVRDGLEMARQYRLPRILQQFIETHHGTTLVEYFYHEASKKEAESGQAVAESEFRYPGPKPASKEAAIVMLTDAVESATRAVKDPTPSRIENVVHTVGMRRLQDGQFDECDLTMRELGLIEESLVKSLCAVYHSRIAYPSTARFEPARSEAV